MYLYQCFNFLARHDGVISFTEHPDDPCKNRCVVRTGEVKAVLEYDSTKSFDPVELFLSQVCKALQAQVEK